MQQAAGAYVAGLAYGALNARAGALGRKALLGGAVYLGSKVRKMVNKSRRKAGGMQRGKKRRSRYGTRGPMTKFMRNVMNAKRSAGAPLPQGSGKRRKFVKPRRKAARPIGTMDTYMQYPKQSIGRLRRMNVRKLAKVSLNYQIVRHQGVNRLNAITVTRDAAGFINTATSPGYYKLFNFTTAGTPVPVHAMLLNTGLATATEGNLQQLQFTPQGNTTWTSLQCQNSSGADVSSQYQNEYSSGVVQVNSRFMRYKWYDIRFCLYGAITQPAIYDIWLVKFNQDELAPFGDTELNTADTRTLANRSSFWQHIVKPVTYHPMLPNVHRGQGGWKVLKHKRVNIPGSSNDDLDVSPPSVQLRWFYRDGRVYDYCWSNQRQSDVNIEGAGWASKTPSTEQSYLPRPKACIYLVIRASNVVQDGDAPTSFAGTPTYDLVVRAGRETMTA